MELPASSARRPFANVAQRGGSDADDVDAGVIVEALVLDGDHCLHEFGGHLVERHFDPLLPEDREDGRVAGVEDGRRLRHIAEPMYFFRIRQTGGKDPERSQTAPPMATS